MRDAVVKGFDLLNENESITEEKVSESSESEDNKEEETILKKVNLLENQITLESIYQFLSDVEGKISHILLI